MELKETHFMKVPYKGGERSIVVDVKYLKCIHCGHEFQTDKQQAAVMLECFRAIPLEEITEEDTFLIAILEETLGIRGDTDGSDSEGSSAEAQGAVEKNA